MIHRNYDGSYVISSRHVWLPGNYDTERAAKYAFRLPDAILARLRDEAHLLDRLIRFEDLQQAARAMKGKGNG